MSERVRWRPRGEVTAAQGGDQRVVENARFSCREAAAACGPLTGPSGRGRSVGRSGPRALWGERRSVGLESSSRYCLTMSQANVDVVRRLFDSFRRRDYAEAAECLATRIRVHLGWARGFANLNTPKAISMAAAATRSGRGSASAPARG